MYPVREVQITHESRIHPAYLVFLFASVVILLTIWSFVVPVFEAPDEPLHWEYARYVHEYWSLPIYTRASLEANQPPLYYWLIAPVAKQSELPLARVALINGTFRAPSFPRFYDEHPSDIWKYWPLRWARLITALLSAMTVLFTYLAGCEATASQHTGIFAAGLVAFLPQFTFRGTNISNDAMVATMSAISTYYIIRLIRRGFIWKTGYTTAVCIALAFLSKISAIIFVPVLAGVLLSGRVNWQGRLKRLVVFLPAAMCVVPWMIRNQVLYGDVFASKAMLRMVPMLVDKKSIWSGFFITTFPTTLFKSLIGVFGWMNVYLPESVYWIFGLLGLGGIAGFLRLFVSEKRLAIALLAVPLLGIAALAELNLTFTQPQGRYLFPALPALAIIIAMGLEMLPRWRPRLTYAILVLLLGINLYSLFGVEFPTYWTPTPGRPVAPSARLVQSSR